jgi:hypothetical protein
MRKVIATAAVLAVCFGPGWATPPPRPGAHGQANEEIGRPAPAVELKTADHGRQAGRFTTIEHGSFNGPPYALVDPNAVQYYKDEAGEIAAGGYTSDYEYKTLEATLISFDGSNYVTDRGGCIYVQSVVTGLQAGDIVEVDNNYFYDDGTGYYSYWDQAPYWVLIDPYTPNPTQTILNWLIYFYDAGAGSYTMVIGSGEYDLAMATDDLTTIIGDRFRLTRDVKVWSGATLLDPQTSSRGYTYSDTGITGGTLANSAALDQTDMTYAGVPEAWGDDDWSGHSNGDIVAGHVFGQDAFETIQRAIDGVMTGATVHVVPGTYDQDEANDRDPVNGGAGSNDFNIFIDKSVTIRGVDSAGDPVTDPDLVEAHILPKRLLPTFGSSAVYVQADDVTLEGLGINAYDADENCKTLEIIGDNVAVRYCALNALDTTSCAYLDDPRFDAGTGTSHVQAYTFEHNVFDGGGIWPGGIRITSGAGWTGSVDDRVIDGNTFVDTCDGIQFVGPGAETWDVYPVGAATISGNSFAGSDRRHVIAWGEYEGGQGYADVDWEGILDDNTFDKGVMIWTPGGECRSWDLPSYGFYHVRGLYSKIMPYAIPKSQAGDTVEVLAGLYPERLAIDKSLELQGAQYGVDPTPSGARTNPANESIITEAGLPDTNPNVLIEIADGVSGVFINGFTLVGDPTDTNADTCVVRSGGSSGTASYVFVQNNIMDGRFGVLFKGGNNLWAWQNRMTTNATGVVVQPNAASEVWIMGNLFAPGTAPVSDAKAIYLTGVSASSVRWNVASGFPWDALAGSNNSSLQVHGNTFTACRKGVSIWGTSTNIIIDDNTLTDCAVAGIDIKGDDLDIMGNHILDNPTGIIIDKHVLNTERVYIYENDILDNGIGLDVTPAVLMLVAAQANNWGTGEGPLDSDGTYEVSAGDCGTDPAAAQNIEPAGGLGNAVIGNADYCPWLSDALLTLRPEGGGTCYKPGDTLIVEVYLSDVATTNNIVGGDFFLAYDETRLALVDDPNDMSVRPGDSPFTTEVRECSTDHTGYQCTPTAGLIDYSVGVPAGDPGTKANTVMARITFTVLTGTNDCDLADLVTFRPNDPPTKLSDQYGNAVYPGTVELAGLGIDSEAPSIAGTVDSGSLTGTCGATVPVNIVVTDNCGVLVADVDFDATTTSGSLDYSGVTAVQTDATTVTISGNAVLTGVTECSATVTFNVGAYDCPGNHGTFTTAGTWSDTTDPTFVGFPGDRTQNADPDLCTAVLVPAIVPPTGADNCDNAVQIDYKRSDRVNWNEGLTDPYPAGVTTITWRATDNCTNDFEQDQTVTIAGVNDIVVTVDIDSLLFGPVDRCITFEVWECGTPKVSVPTVVHFTPAGAYASGTTTIQVPCGDVYTCITARDKLHSLRRKVDLSIAGSPPQYTAAFTNTAGKLLWSGNLNDDAWIDILDYGVFSWQWNAGYDSNGDGTYDGNTTCATPYPHADLTGSGVVQSGDFTPIQVNYLKSRDANCCGAPGFREDETGPITRISVADLIAQGLGELAVGDINGDGWLDEQDMAEFAAGLPPAVVLGDLNCDGAVNFADINPFVMALSNPAAWQQAYPGCNPLTGDINGDGNVDLADINAFIALLGG